MSGGRHDAGRLTERGRRTRSRLLDAAEAELLATGRLEVAGVAARADASLGLLYRYFGDKGELVAAVVDRFYDRYEVAVFATPTAPDVGWFDHERRRLEREVAFLLRDPLSHRVIAGTPQEPAAALADARRQQQHVALAARNIVHGQQRGEIAASVDPWLAAAGFIGALRSVIGVALARDEPPSADAVAELVWTMGAAVIVPTPPR